MKSRSEPCSWAVVGQFAVAFIVAVLIDIADRLIDHATNGWAHAPLSATAVILYTLGTINVLANRRKDRVREKWGPR